MRAWGKTENTSFGQGVSDFQASDSPVPASSSKIGTIRLSLDIRLYFVTNSVNLLHKNVSFYKEITYRISRYSHTGTTERDPQAKREGFIKIIITKTKLTSNSSKIVR